MTMNNSKYLDFDVAVEKFFGQYLVAELNASTNTIKSYRDTFLLLIGFIKSQLNIAIERITLDLFDRTLVCRFLDWLEESKGNSFSTRNQRYACLRSFFSYLMYIDPAHMSQWKLICTIKQKKGKKDVLNYLTVEGMAYFLQCIDVTTRTGRRNLTLLSFLYNTGARVQELIDLTPAALRMSEPYCVEILGKGNKKRLVPFDESMHNLLVKYMEEYNLNEISMHSHPLFFNARGQKLTRPGIAYLIDKYADIARSEHPDLIPKKLSPHCFRHSKAMHLLQAKCPLIYIRDFLGHVSIETTEVYARTDTERKREALEAAYSKVGISMSTQNNWEKDPKLKAFLKSLG